MKPFRWNLARREQLGSLPAVAGGPMDAWSFTRLRDCCVRVVALAGDSELVFLGRSPESLFDYLSGIFADTGWRDRGVLLNLSMRYQSAEEIGRGQPAALRAVREQLEETGLSPAAIASGPRRIAFVDLVYKGSTFGNVAGLLMHWAAEAGVDPAAVRRRVRFVGITERTKNSPNTWRWYQRAEWAERFPRSSLCSVSIDYGLWTYLGDMQSKVSRWHPPAAWGDDAAALPPREAKHLEALREALDLYERGCGPGERARFAALLAARPEMREPWLRRLVLELRGR